jgi:hypothetical protein
LISEFHSCLAGEWQLKIAATEKQRRRHTTKTRRGSDTVVVVAAAVASAVASAFPRLLHALMVTGIWLL